MEALEPRLTLTWAGVPPVAISPGVFANPATLNPNGYAAGNTSISSTEIDYYSFTANLSGSHTISATTPASALDTVLGVFSSSGARLAYNDNISGSNRDSRLTVNLQAGQRYLVGVTNFVSFSRGDYTWIIQGPSFTPPVGDDAYENNDTLATAADLGTLTSPRTISQLQMADASDYYKFTTTARGTNSASVSIQFQNAQGNLQLALYASNGALLTSSIGTGNAETILLNNRPAGTYYVRVYGNAGAANPNYTLTINPPTGGGASNFQITLSMEGLTASQENIFRQAAARWSQVIVGDLPSATFQGVTVDDLLIRASSVPIDGVSGILGQAAPDAFRGNQIPYHGFMEFDTADMASMEANGTLMAVVMHEMGHVLGVGTIWSSLGLISGRGTTNPTFTGAQATAAYNQIFSTNVSGVPVENTGGGGTRDAHWRESILKNELMTGWTGPGTIMPLSRVTVASLADMGYTVNLAMADPYTPSVMSSLLVQQMTPSDAYLFRRKFYPSIGLGDIVLPGAGLALRSNTTAIAESGLIDSSPSVNPFLVPNSAEQFALPQSARTETLSRVTEFDLPTTFHRDAIDVLLTRAFEAERDEESPLNALTRNDPQDGDFDEAWDEFGASLSEDMWRTAAL
jgi:hypothetical protein